MVGGVQNNVGPGMVGGYYGYGYGRGRGFALIVVLFILLIIVGASKLGYKD
nr:YjcZ family sporulation protein [Alteribacillus bidgolensis]